MKRRGQSFTRLNVEYDTRLIETQPVLDTLVGSGKLLEIGPVSGGIILYTLRESVEIARDSWVSTPQK